MLSVLRAFGFDDFSFNLSTKDPNKYVGTDESWEPATAALRRALERHGLDYAVKEGDAAFYGPKIDIDVRDAIGRSWQLSTIQYDFNMTERFELEYVGADNDRHRPIMLHRALFGSVERFFGVLLEHYAGDFPTWLAPVQVRVLPVSTAHEEYAKVVADRIHAAGGRVDVVHADDQLGKRIRAAEAGEDPVRARRRRRRRRRRHRGRQPARRRGRARRRPSTSSSPASPTRWRAANAAALGRERPCSNGSGTAGGRAYVSTAGGSAAEVRPAACSRGSCSRACRTPRPTSFIAVSGASRS